MEKSPRKGNQLLPNRGIVHKINPVVRKKAKSKNTQVPPEWNEVSAQAFRLLVGPRINNYITPESQSQTEVDSRMVEQEKKNAEAQKLLYSLVPSRLKTPYEPFQVTTEHIDALEMPADLIPQVFSPEERPKFNLIQQQKKKRPKTKIIRPFKPPPDAQPVKGDVSQRPNTSMSPKIPPVIEFEAPLEEKVDQSHEEEEEKKEIRITKLDSPPKSPIRKKKIFIPKKEKKTTRIRMYFYVLRCWARYNINARVKSMFVIDIHEAQVQLQRFHEWHKYVACVVSLRKRKNMFLDWKNDKNQKLFYFKWKKSAKRAISNANVAAKALVLRQRNLSENMFKIMIDVTHSKRICRRETNKMFRYHPEGPFSDINDYYTSKREMNVKASHFCFNKQIPRFIKRWRWIVERNNEDRRKIELVHMEICKIYFHQYFDLYQQHFHERQMTEIRHQALAVQFKLQANEKETAERVEKTIMIQLIRDRNILKAKLDQFDRLSQNHREAVQRRQKLRSHIDEVTADYFKRQEELQLIDHYKQAAEVQRKTREMRMQLAEGFLYHIGRAVRSYDNQVVAHEFCLSFRILSEPIVNRAVGYYYEKHHIKQLIAAASRGKKTLEQIVHCSKLYHQNFGWEKWRKYITSMNCNRSNGLMEAIRRRTVILQMYPYFNWVEVLPVRPPRPLKEVEQMFKDLPLVSIQRKVARERVHHVNVRMMLMRRRVLRDFVRSLASFVQTQIATREVMKLIRKKQRIRTMRTAFEGLRSEWMGEPPQMKITQMEKEITANIHAWIRHFFRERIRQNKIVEEMPLN